MKNILILTATLNLGGITSFVLPLAKVLSQENHVILAYMDDPYQKLKELPQNVEAVQYEAPSKKKTIYYMISKRWLHHAFKVKFRNHSKITYMPSLQRLNFAEAMVTRLPSEVEGHFDLAISAVEFYCNDLLVEKVDADRKIGWIHPDYGSLHTDVLFDKKVLDKLDRIVTVSETNRESFIKTIPEYAAKTMYIPNLIDEEKIKQLASDKPEEYEGVNVPIVVTVARLDNSSKRLDRIVQACSLLKSKGYTFEWFLIGEGDDYGMIQELSDKMGTTDVLHLLGGKINPYPYMKHADVFVLTSQYEGRPVVVDEAMLLQCPVIVTRYVSAQEQVGELGTIVSNDNMSAQNIADALMEECWKKKSGCLEKQKDRQECVLQRLLEINDG